jgi:hypothetical protein
VHGRFKRSGSPAFYTLCLQSYIGGIPIPVRRCQILCTAEVEGQNIYFLEECALVPTGPKTKRMFASTHDKQGGRGRYILPD